MPLLFPTFFLWAMGRKVGKKERQRSKTAPHHCVYSNGQLLTSYYDSIWLLSNERCGVFILQGEQVFTGV
jgi:hypothetical protein